MPSLKSTPASLEDQPQRKPEGRKSHKEDPPSKPVNQVKPVLVDQATTMTQVDSPHRKAEDQKESVKISVGNCDEDKSQVDLLDLIDSDRRLPTLPSNLDDRFLGGGMVGGHLGVYRSASMPGYTNKARQVVSRATSMCSGSLSRSSMTRRTLRQKHTKSWTPCDGAAGCTENWSECPVHKVCTSVVDVAVMQEAHGLIMDMLADSTLPPNVVSGLKAVSTLLSPPTNYNTLQRPKISPLVALSESSYTSDIDDSPYVGERPLSLPKRLRRSLPPSLIRRMSTTWTTTTSATGMPTLEPQPLRTRSSSFRHSRDLTSSPSPGNSRSSSPAPSLRRDGGEGSLKSRSFSMGTGGLSPRSPSPNLLPPEGKVLRSSSLRASLGGSSVPTLLRTENGQSAEMGEALDTADDSEDEATRLEELSNQPITLTITPDESAKEAVPRAEEADPTVVAADNNNTNTAEKMAEPATMTSSLKPRGSGKKRGSVTISEHATIIEEGSMRTIPTEDVDIKEGEEEQEEALETEENLEEMDPVKEECRELLSQLDEWDYPIFTLSELSDNQVLSQVAYRLFSDAGIFETFRITIPEFMNYFRALENGYRHKPYHNRIHAADVLHGCYYMSTQQIPGFTQVSPEDLDPMGRQDDDPDSFHTPTVTPRASLSSDSSYGILAGNLPALELMALYTAAAMHDYDHPARTNAFLVATNAPQAILYNDRSVLENHHAAASWSLFLSKPEYNFLTSLDVAEFKRFRFLVVEFILATDLKRHFDFLVEFNAKVNDVDAPGINWASESDRLLVCQMCIKLADISGPTKVKDLHCNWTYRISEEFYEQGDEERQLGLPVSPYMDRAAPQLAKLQEGFINHLVAPLCNAYGSAGLLPGRWLDEEEDGDFLILSFPLHAGTPKPETKSENNFSDKEQEDDEDDDNDNDDTSNDGDTKLRLKSAGQQKTRKMVSILTKHLKENHEMWLKVLKEEEEEKRRAENPDGLPPSPTSKEKEDATSVKSMAPIREDSEERNSDCGRSTEGENGPSEQELGENGCQDNGVPNADNPQQKGSEET
ncbi:cGMP-inhibited 3',5'-cyclic phosphodiesterase 3A-like [Diadema setosum]|uniref:cGMP-inhibited 3',5'-cyclic phosphodiesterase 3A-like n=1 Tax=Diadema setosum TaxID=31175 RepID=UPI003B3A0ADA